MSAERLASHRNRYYASYAVEVFKLAGTSGSHQKWRNPVTGKQVIVPYHRGRILPLGTMRSIIEGSGIELENWLPS